MRLSDHIIAEVGGPDDIGGLFTSTAAAIREAERFELTDDVSRAAYNLTRLKPSSLLKTMPLCRAPYRKMWFEWRGGLTSSLIRPEHKRDPRTHPDPIKQGVLIETDETGQRGSMTFAWMHDHRLRKSSGVSINPLGTLFNWHEDGNVHDDLRRVIQGRYPTKPPLDMIAGASLDVLCAGSYQRTLSDEDAKAWMAGSSFKLWATLGQQRERTSGAADAAPARDAVLPVALPGVPELVRNAGASEQQDGCVPHRHPHQLEARHRGRAAVRRNDHRPDELAQRRRASPR
jgi:hypothetical protein